LLGTSARGSPWSCQGWTPSAGECGGGGKGSGWGKHPYGVGGGDVGLWTGNWERE